MTFEEAKSKCHVRSAIYRTGNPTKIFTQEDLEKLHPSLQHIHIEDLGKRVPNRYWKNQLTSLDERVPDSEQAFDDWEEFDPRDDDTCSLAAFND